jgi:hypothetical protein
MTMPARVATSGDVARLSLTVGRSFATPKSAIFA